MDDADVLAERFEAHRGHLRAVAYRMLGSVSEAEDAVQEAWFRLHRSDTSDVTNLGGWLTTVVGRLCLDMLRVRRTRREEPLPWPAAGAAEGAAEGSAGGGTGGPDPEEQALLADSVGVALLVVLETLEPAERLAFVLHDMFAVPFDEIGVILDRSAGAARQLASRARRRVQGGTGPAPEPDFALQRRVVDAFLAAARSGDFDALLTILAPDVVARAEITPGVHTVIRGASKVARGALGGLAGFSRPTLVNGTVGLMTLPESPDHRVVTFTLTGSKITEMHIHGTPTSLATLTLSPLP